MRLPSKPKTRRGSAAVEFAILAPFLFTVLIGIWELGRIIEVHQLLANAAREGGRQASTGNYDPTQIETFARRYLKRAGLPDAAADTATVTVTNLTSGLPPATADQLDHFRVTVSLRYADVRWTPLALLTNDETILTGSADWNSTRDIPIELDTNIPLK
jgi:Flp pilus assembly protein TadG